MMKIRTCAIYRRTKHNGKACNINTTWSRATSGEWIYAWVPVRSSKMVDQCANMAATQILYLHEEAVLRKKKNVINQATAALRRSVVLARFITVWKNRTGHTHTHIHTHTHTHTHNYCNPAAHARRGLTQLYFFT